MAAAGDGRLGIFTEATDGLHRISIRQRQAERS
jgi:hypothetical protein